MSVRAYRIIMIETEDEPSLNLSRQDDLAMEIGFYADSGEFEVDREKLGNFLKDKKRQEELGVEREQLEQLQKDYDDTIGDDYISYTAW